MKLNLKNKYLTATICLALVSSSAFAMPTGGEIVAGEVGGFASDLSNGANLTVGENGAIVTWNDFSIAAGEALNVDVVKNANFLNYVTGDNISYLMGILNQTGDGGMTLVNPNGIIIGNGAVINANELNLMAMGIDATGDDLKNRLKNFSEQTFIVKDGASKLIIGTDDSAAAPKLTLNDKLNLLGGSIQIADGVIISSNPDTQNGGLKLDDIHMYAGNKAQFSDDNITLTGGTANNKITVGNVELTANNTVDMYAGSIELANTNIKTGEVGLYAFSSATNDGVQVSANNEILLNNVNISTANVDNHNTNTGNISMSGGYIDIENSKISAGEGTERLERVTDTNIHISAGNMEFTNNDTEVITTTAGNSVVLTNSDIQSSKGRIGVMGHDVTIQKTDISAPVDHISVAAASDILVSTNYDKNKESIQSLNGTAENTLYIDSDSKLTAKTMTTDPNIMLGAGKATIAGTTYYTKTDENKNDVHLMILANSENSAVTPTTPKAKLTEVKGYHIDTPTPTPTPDPIPTSGITENTNPKDVANLVNTMLKRATTQEEKDFVVDFVLAIISVSNVSDNKKSELAAAVISVVPDAAEATTQALSTNPAAQASSTTNDMNATIVPVTTTTANSTIDSSGVSVDGNEQK